MSEKIFSPSYIKLCVSSFLFHASFSMIIPELPDYLTGLGGKDHLGLIIALFTLTGGLSRPFAGKLLDFWGRKPVLIIGAVVSITAAVSYPIMSFVSGFLLLRLFHGFSVGFTPTAISAYVSDIIKPEKRGEAMGFLTIFSTIGMSIGPGIGGYIAQMTTIQNLFYFSALVALSAFILFFTTKETLLQAQSFQWNMLVLKKEDWFSPQASWPFIIMVLYMFGYGAILTICPLKSSALGIQNKGLFFVIFTASSLLIRLFIGKISDRFGRVLLIKIGLIVVSISLIIIAYSGSSFIFFVGSVLFGIGLGTTSPTISAWTIDLSLPEKRGRSIATMFLGMEAGIGIGAYFSGWFTHDYQAFASIFIIASGLCLLAFLSLSFRPNLYSTT